MLRTHLHLFDTNINLPKNIPSLGTNMGTLGRIFTNIVRDIQWMCSAYGKNAYDQGKGGGSGLLPSVNKNAFQ